MFVRIHRQSLLAAVLTLLIAATPASSRTKESGAWFIAPLRAVEQEGLEHRVCALNTDEILFCFEFIWQNGYLEFWIQLQWLEGSPRRFEDGMATEFWIDGELFGQFYRKQWMGSTNATLDMDRFLGANRAEYYFYGGTWLFFREGVAAPPVFLSNKGSFFHKLTQGSHLRLVHYLEGGETFETEYDMAGLAPFLIDLHTEAAAMESAFGKPQLAED